MFLKKVNWLFFILGKDEPVAPTLHIKPKDPKTFVTPSPGAYNPVSGGGKFIYVHVQVHKHCTILSIHIIENKNTSILTLKISKILEDSVYGIGHWPFNW